MRGGGGFQKYQYFFWGGGYEDFVDILGGHDKVGLVLGVFLCILGSFLKVNVQNEIIFAWQKFQIFFVVLDILDIFWRQTVDAGPNPTYEEKVRVPPPPPTHTHTHSPWVTVYGEKLLAR